MQQLSNAVGGRLIVLGLLTAALLAGVGCYGSKCDGGAATEIDASAQPDGTRADTGPASLVLGRSYTLTASMTWTEPTFLAQDRLPKTVVMTVRPFMQGDEPRLLIGVTGALANVPAVVTGHSWKSDGAVFLGGRYQGDLGKCVIYPQTSMERLELDLSSAAITGTAGGYMSFFVSDAGVSVNFTAVLSGERDRAPPVLVGSWTNPTNSLDSLVVTVSEPLSPAASLRLRPKAQSAPSVLLDVAPNGQDNIFTSTRALSPGQTYTLEVSTLADLDGNALLTANPLPPFETSDPGLFPQDGFESGQGGTLEGNAAVISDSEVISGQQSLRLNGGPNGPGSFTARMIVPPGATVIRATMVATLDFTGPHAVNVHMAAPSQPIRILSVQPAATISNGAFTWPLPEGTSNEVMFRVSTSGCESGAPVVRIDDLRVE